MTSTAGPGPATDRSDLIYGAKDIAAFLNMRVGPVRSLIEKRTLPTFKIGKTVCARRSSLNAWLAEREAAALAAQYRPPGGC